MALLDMALFVAGAAMLIAGADLLVRGASRIALTAGISPLVVGLTIVAFGTSAPELAITARAAIAGSAELALGNVVGSNIFNTLFILGITAAVAPIIVSQQLIRFDVPLGIGASVFVAGMSLDGTIGRVDGAFLFSGILCYLGYLTWQSRRESSDIPAAHEALETPPPGTSSMLTNVLLMLAGLALLIAGARWLVSASVAVAQALGVGELVIGLTIVAAGTSLPEVATSVIAGLRGERDIAVGNIVGSNLFNLFAVLGAGGLLAPEGIPVPSGALTFDIPVMVAASIGILPICFSGYRIARWEGFLLVGYYVAYTAFVVLQAVDHAAVNEFATAMRFFVFPLTGITIVVISWRAYRRRS